MKNKPLLLLFLLGYHALSAQISGVVVDSLTRKPIPYVSIWVENENNGATTEENGTFALRVSDKRHRILFSALGYRNKSVLSADKMAVELAPAAIELSEVVLTKKYGNRQLEIGETDSSFLEAYENAPRIDVKFFPYEPRYKKTKFIKQVVLNTDCRIEEALLKLHFFKVDASGLPGEELLDKDLLVSVSKGVKRTSFNLSSQNLRMPKEGLFVGFERLKIEKNKYEKAVFDSNTQTSSIQTSYCPLILYNRVEQDHFYRFAGGKWLLETMVNEKGENTKKVTYEPAINLILTN